MTTMKELKAQFTALSGLEATAKSVRENQSQLPSIEGLSLNSTEAWKRLVDGLKEESPQQSNTNVSIDDVLSLFDTIDPDNKQSDESITVNKKPSEIPVPVLQQQPKTEVTKKSLGSDIRINAFVEAKLLEVSINEGQWLPLEHQLQKALEPFYQPKNKAHNIFIPTSKQDKVTILDSSEDNDIMRTVNLKNVLLTAVAEVPEFIKKQLLNDPIALFKYLNNNRPYIPYKSYSVPSYTALMKCKETVGNSIIALRSKLNKLTVQYDFWTNETGKQSELALVRKIRLSKRLLAAFIKLEERLLQLPNETVELSCKWPKLQRQYMVAIKATFAVVKKQPVNKAIANEIPDSKFNSLIDELTPKLETAHIYDLTCLNSDRLRFRGADLTTSKNGVIKSQAGFTGSALHAEKREVVRTETGTIREDLVPSDRLVDRKPRSKSQSTFGKALPQINGLGKTLGSLLTLPPTLYRTTSNLYWLLDTSFQGLKMNEQGDYVKANSGLIAAIRVSKNADYGYFNVGELYINKHRQIAYRVPKKSLAFVNEVLAIPLDEIIEGFCKLGLYSKGKNGFIEESKMYCGVINRGHQKRLKDGQLDILTDNVLSDLGVTIKRTKGTGSYAVTQLCNPSYGVSMESFVTVDMGVSTSIPRKQYSKPKACIVVERLKGVLVESAIQYRQLDENSAKNIKRLSSVVKSKDEQIKSQSEKIKQLEHQLRLAKNKR